jgi:hypothetical protein
MLSVPSSKFLIKKLAKMGETHRNSICSQNCPVKQKNKHIRTWHNIKLSTQKIEILLRDKACPSTWHYHLLVQAGLSFLSPFLGSEWPIFLFHLPDPSVLPT